MHNTVGILVCHHPTPDTNIALSARVQLTVTVFLFVDREKEHQLTVEMLYIGISETF